MFAPFAGTRTVRWRPAAGDGLEHLTIEALGDGGVELRSVIVGERGGIAYGARYRIRCDAGWRAREFGIETTDGRGLAMTSTEPGRWRDANGTDRSELDGCLDVDLAATPATNTLPIRRLDLRAADGPVELSVLWVPFDTFEPFRDEQRYAALENGRLYRFEAVDGGFAADLAVDGDGLVLDYPGLFARA